MRNWANKLFILSLCSALAACSPTYTNWSQQIYVFGTLVNVTLRHDNKREAEDAFKEIDARLQHIQTNWNPIANGELMAVNQALANGEKITVSDELKNLITLSTDLSLQSGEVFNPAIGKLIAQWKFDRERNEDDSAPDKKTTQALVTSNPRMTDLIWDGNQLSTNNPDVQLTFGAIAKGVAIDDAIAIIKKHGIHDAIVNAGGDLRVLGNAGDHHWTIGVRNPQGEGAIAKIELNDGEALFTSGDYERKFKSNGKTYHHIIDPRTGLPSIGISSTTVLHRNGGVADAAATALIAGGMQQWQTISHNMNLKYVLIVDNNGKPYMTEAMQQRVQLLAQ